MRTITVYEVEFIAFQLAQEMLAFNESCLIPAMRAKRPSQKGAESMTQCMGFWDWTDMIELIPTSPNLSRASNIVDAIGKISPNNAP